MKRREFLKAPAAAVLFPAASGMERLLPQNRDESGDQPGKSSTVEQALHPDFITFVPGIEYFYLGNGEIQGAVQYSPLEKRTSFIGFTMSNPEVFCRKWSTYLYHPERGFANTRVGITIDDRAAGPDNASGMYHGVRGYKVAPESFASVRWKFPESVPVVSLQWRAGLCPVEEEFFVPWEGAVLFRRVTVRNDTDHRLGVSVNLSQYPNFGLFDDIRVREEDRAAHAKGLAQMRLAIIDRPSTVAGRYDVHADLGSIAPGESARATYMYSINGGEAILSRKPFAQLWGETVEYWKTQSSFRSGNADADELFNIAHGCLRSIISRSGKMDGGTWMYNMEWLGDHLLAMEGLLRCGNVPLAKVMLENNLKRYVGPDGRTIESGRWFGYEFTELNQNGLLLYAAWVYYCWTGDLETLTAYWPTIRLCGDFPLLSHFLHPETGMVHNKREFWERSDTHGVKDGYELAYQFWVSFGLARGAELARKVGDGETADRWLSAAARMKGTALEDPRFHLIEDGHLIKRRTVEGEWQRYFIPPDRNSVPAGSPLATLPRPDAEPDVITVYPIMFDWVDPRSPLAAKTLAWVEPLWNHAWTMGGYSRYNSRSEDNPAAPWPLASMLVARAYAEAGDTEKAWRVVEWLRGIHGGLSGGWFERYGQSITPPMPPVGVVGWIWYELIALYIHHFAGFRPEADRILIRPSLPAKLPEIVTTQLVRRARVNLTVRRSAKKQRATVNGMEVPFAGGRLELDYPPAGSVAEVVLEV